MLAATPPATTKIFLFRLLCFSNSKKAIFVFLYRISIIVFWKDAAKSKIDGYPSIYLVKDEQVIEFEDIVVHYLGFGENQLAKKALNMGLEQHPSSIVLMLLQSEILILDEATSALDNDTVQKVGKTIEKLKTVAGRVLNQWE